jgi:hypothetical protein
MTKNNLYHGAWKLRATGALVLALALSTFPAAFSRAVKAQAPGKATAQTPAKTAASPAGESKGGQKEGIKVHGHWTIDVRNPDGTLVTHREFENALKTTGARAMAQMLGRQASPGIWVVLLANSGGVGPCQSNQAPGNACLVTEATDPAADSPPYFKTLTLTVPFDSIALVLSGTATADNTGSINEVVTRMRVCSPTTATATCVGGTANLVTQASLATPVNVVGGQIIQVTVVISFS